MICGSWFRRFRPKPGVTQNLVRVKATVTEERVDEDPQVAGFFDSSPRRRTRTGVPDFVELQAKRCGDRRQDCCGDCPVALPAPPCFLGDGDPAGDRFVGQSDSTLSLLESGRPDMGLFGHDCDSAPKL